MSSQYCTSCGNELEKTDNYCDECGDKISSRNDESGQNEESSDDSSPERAVENGSSEEPMDLVPFLARAIPLLMAVLFFTILIIMRGSNGFSFGGSSSLPVGEIITFAIAMIIVIAVARAS